MVIPSRVSSDGGFITHTLHAHHKIWKRSVDDAGASSDDVIHYQIPLSDRTLQVKLQVNSKLLTPSTVVETRTGRYKNVSDSMFKILDHRGCHFTGHVTGEDNSRAAISACGGLVSLFKIVFYKYFHMCLYAVTLQLEMPLLAFCIPEFSEKSLLCE